MAARKLVFELKGHVDPAVIGPRLARVLMDGRKDLHTPNFIAVTSRGVVPHMTPDVILANSEIGAVHMALEDFIERGTPPIYNCPGSPLHTFTALPEPLITVLAPRRNPAVTAPNGNTNSAISLFTSTGFQTLTAKSYSEAIRKLKPDISIALADIPYGTVPGAKRLTKMGNRTEDWLAQLIHENGNGHSLFAAILPIDSLSQNEYLLSLDEQADKLAGLAFYDSNVLPDIPATTALSILPRLCLDEPASPHHILRQISLGMDIFTIPFINFATDAGIALSFVFPRPPLNPGFAVGPGLPPLPLGLDMWTPEHANSLNPLLPCCQCYTCTTHHIAFVQHLLSAKEMLGWVLIQAHNHHIISQFFAAIRESIKNGTFDADAAEFASIYESELPAKSGQGPRQRGYHNKSRANQKKINEKGWLGEDAFGSGVRADGGLLPEEMSSAA